MKGAATGSGGGSDADVRVDMESARTRSFGGGKRHHSGAVAFRLCAEVNC